MASVANGAQDSAWAAWSAAYGQLFGGDAPPQTFAEAERRLAGLTLDARVVRAREALALVRRDGYAKSRDAARISRTIGDDGRSAATDANSRRSAAQVLGKPGDSTALFRHVALAA